MDDRQRDLDRRIRRVQRQELFRNLWEARLIIGIGVATVVVTLLYVRLTGGRHS